MKTTLKALTLASLAAISLSASAKVSDGQKFGDWEGTCQGNDCGVVQAVNNDKGQPVGQILIRKVKEANNAPTLFVTVPLGVNLRAGMAFAVDGKELGVVPYDFCIEGGCNAAVPLDADSLAKIKAGAALQVAAFVGDKQQTMGFSLKGVTAAINAL